MTFNTNTFSKLYYRPILFVSIFFIFLGTISRLTFVDIDLFHEMALFREALILGELPRQDIFSYIPTISPVVHHEWGTGALLYLIVVKLGFGAWGLILLKYLLTLSIIIGCYKFSIQYGGNDFNFFSLSMVAITLGHIGFTTIRAQLFTIFLLIMLFFLIEEDRRGNRFSLLAVFPVFILWINLHAGFIVGLFLFGMYIAERIFVDIFNHRRVGEVLQNEKGRLFIFIAVCISLFLTPYGYEYFPCLWKAITLDRTPLSHEWRPIWQTSTVIFFIYSVAIVIVLYCLIQKKATKLPGLAMVSATAYEALLHYRHLSIFALAWLCYVPVYLTDTPLGDLIERMFKKRLKAISIIFVSLGVLGLSISIKNHFWQLQVPTDIKNEGDKFPIIYPSGAAAYLKENNFVGNLMVPFSVGAFISWNLYPDVKVSMDSRFEVAYSYESAVENMKFYCDAKSDWLNIPFKYETDAILIPNWLNIKKEFLKISSDPHSKSLLKRWTQVYTDVSYSIYMEPNQADDYPIVDLGQTTIKGVFP